MSLRNHPACIGNDYDTLLSGEIVTSAACWISSSLPTIVVRVLLWIILTEPDREIAGPGWCVDADGLERSSSGLESDSTRQDSLTNENLLHLTVGGVFWPYVCSSITER